MVVSSRFRLYARASGRPIGMSSLRTQEHRSENRSQHRSALQHLTYPPLAGDAKWTPIKTASQYRAHGVNTEACLPKSIQCSQLSSANLFENHSISCYLSLFPKCHDQCSQPVEYRLVHLWIVLTKENTNYCSLSHRWREGECVLAAIGVSSSSVWHCGTAQGLVVLTLNRKLLARSSASRKRVE